MRMTQQTVETLDERDARLHPGSRRQTGCASPDRAGMKADAENVGPAPRTRIGELGEQLLAWNRCHFGADPARDHFHVLTSAR